LPDPTPDLRAEQLQLLDALAEQFAGELHDGPVQWMVGAKMQAEAMRRQVAEGQKIEPIKFDALLETLSRGLAEARRMMQGLHGPELSDGRWQQPLLWAQQHRCKRLERRLAEGSTSLFVAMKTLF